MAFSTAMYNPDEEKLNDTNFHNFKDFNHIYAGASNNCDILVAILILTIINLIILLSS